MSDLQKKFSHALYRLAKFMEIVVAIILVVAICITLIAVIRGAGQLWQSGGTSSAFQEFLKMAFTVVIGIEFLEMLCRHSMRSVLEVILFAIAKQMVVEHASATDTLIMVIALAILFVVRKYLFVPDLDTDHPSHPHNTGSEEK